MSIFLYSSEQSFYILCSYSGFRQFPWRRSFKERDGETNQGGGHCRSCAAVRQARGIAYSLNLQGIGACAIVGANNYQSLRSLAEFTIPDLVDRRRSRETDGRIQSLDALAVSAWGALKSRHRTLGAAGAACSAGGVSHRRQKSLDPLVYGRSTCQSPRTKSWCLASASASTLTRP